MAVPRLLLRPGQVPAPVSAAREPAPEPVSVVHEQVPAAAAVPAPMPVPTPTVQLARPAARSMAGRHAVVTAAGRLLGDSVRQALGPLRCRVCVGVLGRESSGKSFLVSQLQGQWAAAEPPTGPTLGIDAWVTGASSVLVDTPPVMGPACNPGWAPRHAPRRAAARIRDLQIALLLLQVCDTLVLVVDGASRDSGEPCVDLELARLLAAAAGLAKTIPGFTTPRVAPTGGPAETAQGPGCCLHIAIVPARHAALVGHDCDAIARAYEAAANIAVTGVSVVPRRTDYLDPPLFPAIAGSWASSHPLYPPRARGKPAVRAIIPPSVLSSSRKRGGPNFDQCMQDMRVQLLGPRADSGRADWAAACARAWDSIRRSDHLLRLATAHDSRSPHPL